MAIGLLWPFADWSWWPIVAGLGVLVPLYLLRLDRLLFGWAPHLAGVVTVVLLAARSDPWAWGLAAGIAVLGAGLVRLPERRLLVAGGALVLVFGVAYGVVHFRSAEQRHAASAQAAARQTSSVTAIAPELLARVLARGIATGDGRTTCDLLGAPAGDQLAASVGVRGCAEAVRVLGTRVGDARVYASPRLPPAALVKQPGAAGQPGTATLDGCQASWSSGSSGSSASSDPAATADPGPALGRFTLRQYQDSDRYLITGYSPCR